MSNKYSIDELFREGLSEGREQLNLGAWANMDRMLNGQNPYTEEEQPTQRKKRRWLPLLLIGVLVTAIIGAGTYLLNHSHESNSEFTKSEKQSQETNPQNNQTESTHTQKSYHIDSPENNTSNENNKNKKGYIRADKKSDINTQTSRLNKKSSNNSDEKIADVINDKKNDKQINKDNIAFNENNKNEKITKHNTKSEIKIEKDKAENNELKNTELALENSNTKHKESKKIKQTVNTIVTKETVVKDEYNVNNTKVDTISVTQSEITKEKYIDVVSESNTETKGENTNYHPRYIGAHIYVEGPQKENEVAKVATPQSENENKQRVDDTKQNTIAKNDKNKENDWKSSMANTFAQVGAKTGDFFSTFKKLDLGISLGLSVALFGTKNNYGGFQGGITNATRISDNLSLLSELKFFLHNNAGFTINQIQTNIFNQSKDTLTFAPDNQTLYAYQVDSIVKKYNFKNFMSLQLPMMLQYTFNRFGIYAGANFAYNFKIATTQADNKYVKSYFAKVDNGKPYEFPTGSATDYDRSDFRARFGIGYAVGFNCYINSKVYVDLRLAKQLWDNSNNNSMKEISTGVTKVPFTQLSIGYKFNNKD